MRGTFIIALIVIASVGTAACGSSSTSSADKAKSNACAATSDIKKQVTTIQGVTSGTVSPSDAKSALQAIQKDLQTIQAQIPDLKGSIKQQLQTANAAFKTQVQTIASSITGAQSLSGAATALATAAQTLASSYQQAFGNVSC